MASEAKPFASNIHFGPSCWEWMSYKNPKGYGRCKVNGKMTLAHRHAYEIAYGPIPDGLCVCHRCDNPACVRRDHLFLGTHQDNATDKMSKKRHAGANKSHCDSGHEFTKVNTYVGSEGKRACMACRRRWVAEYKKRKKELTAA